MALPSYWVSLNRKDLAERAIVAKRNKEASRVQKCKEVASYHEEHARKSSKYKSLEDAQGLKIARANEESRIKEKLKAEKQDRLEKRRKRLAHFLKVEEDQYMSELNELKEGEKEKDPYNITKLKEQIEDLQRKRKEGQQDMQRRNQLFRSSNSIYSKEADDEALKKEASEAWEQRKKEFEKLSIEKKQKEQERMETFEKEQVKATNEVTQVEMTQLQEQMEWSNFIEEKLKDIKAVENEAKKLTFEKQILLSHLENVLSLQQRRDLVRDIQKKGALKIHALWQAKEKLRKMSNEVQHSLDLDLKMLLNISAMNISAFEDTVLAVLNLECVNDIKDKVESQIALEKERELEMQQLFNEEASKLWHKRKEDWSLEAIARDEIINDLFKTLSKEIKEKLENNTDNQNRLIQIKESYLKEINEFNENAKSRKKTLDEKRAYFIEKAKKLENELQSYRSSSSCS